MAHKNTSWDKVVTIYSPGGGTGKSEIAASLAYVLAEKGKKIWLIDANLFAPSLDILYDLNIDNNDTLNEFLLNGALSEIPVCDISHVIKGRSKGRLYLTPSVRNDTEKRYQVERALIEDESTCEKIPEAVFRGLGDEIDFLIVDTHPGFERVNQVWLGITWYLIILTRITDVDLANLKMHLKEKDLLDIRKKLILFNNVCLDEKRTATMTMNNRQMQEKFTGLIRNPSLVTGSRDTGDSSTEIFPNHIPYSEELALYPSSKGLYVQNHKTSKFAEIVTALSEKILKDLDTY
jgi:MinD-like ATPase involved in chromosome partitioning or flagellar assembly